MQRKISYSLRAILTCALIGCVMIAAFSCATAPPVQTEEDVRAVTALAAAGETGKLTEQSHIPFLFDGEILVRSRDAAEMWRLIAASGLFGENPPVADFSGVGPESYTLFSDTKQVELFFSKYVSDHARIAVIDTPHAILTLLLDGKSEGYSRIAGMKVDVR